MQTVKKVGLIVNPIAGMGGKTALKGTDGVETLALAFARGAEAEAQSKAARALKIVADYKQPPQIFTCGGCMGDEVCRKVGLAAKNVYSFFGRTTSKDTVNGARAIMDEGVDLLLFAGGDGTARDICSAIGKNIPVIGIPAGVKIQSAVFAVSPEAAGRLLCSTLEDNNEYALREVVDLDEEEYRHNHISSKLYGYMSVPVDAKMMQSMKVSGIGSDKTLLQGAADEIISQMTPDCYYAVGSGTNSKSIMERLGLAYELLGVDIVHNRSLISRDVTERQLLELCSSVPLKIIVSPIGGQGFIFGRGNHQFSPKVLNHVGKENIYVISTQEKLISILDFKLRVDSGSIETDKNLRGYYNVVCGYKYKIIVECI